MSHNDIPARSVQSAVLSYGLSIASVLVALLVTFLTTPDRLVSPLFFLSIMLSAWVGGIGPGLTAAFLATLAVSYFFLSPTHTLLFAIDELPQLLVFFLSALVVSSWSASRKRTETLLRQARDEQEAKVQARTAEIRQANDKMQAEIVERRRVEETLRERASLLDLTHDTVFARGMDDVITYWNRGANELYGWTSEEAMGQVCHRLMQTIFPAPFEEINKQLLDTGRWRGELIHVKRDGAQVVVASRWALQCDESGQPVAILETNNDITERKGAEEALRQSEERWRHVFEHNPTMYFIVDPAGTVLSVNPFGAEQLGYSVNELAGDSVLKVFHEADRKAAQKNVAACLEQPGHPMSWELRKIRKDGSLLWVRETARAVPSASGPIVLVACEDITERKRAEESLRESERRHRYIFQAAGVSIWEEDFSQVKAAIDEVKGRGVQDFGQYMAAHPEFVRQAIPMVRIVDVNDATVRLFEAQSKSELLVSLGKIFLEETEEVFAGEITALAEGHSSFEAETVLKTLRGGKLTVLLTVTFPPDPARLDSVLVSIVDITERKRAEQALLGARAELAHVTRVATLGELTASIAHEINQPLGAIVNNASACLRWLTAENLEEARSSAKLAIEDAHRAAEIIQRIRSFAKKAPPQKDWIGINQIIREVIALARSEMRRHNVDVETQFSDDARDIPLVFADRIQLQQVILNLIMNAIEAMSAVSNRPRELLIRSGLDGSQNVTVSVCDSGPGLDSNSLERLFEPFYSTKPQGMGMGLAICRSIIEAHGGRLWAPANDGRGATFQFKLPIGGVGA